jgi:hypothetical protein
MKRIFVYIVITVLLISLIIPTISAMTPQPPQLTTKDQISNSIEQGFDNYLQTTNLQQKNMTVAFRNFIKTNPIYQLQLAKLTNLTIAESLANLQKPPTNIDVSKAIVSAPYETINTTIDGKTYQISYSNATINGRSFVKICGPGGFDPWVELERTYMTAYYFNDYQTPITYGEVDHIQVMFPAADTVNFKIWFDSNIPYASTINKVIWTAAGGILAFIAPVGLGASLASMLGGPSGTDISDLQQIIDGMIETGNALNLRIDDTYIYPTISPMDLFDHLNDLSIYASCDGGYNFQKAFPVSGFPWEYDKTLIAEQLSEASSWAISDLYNQGAATIGENTWAWVNEPFFPEMPQGDSMLKSITIDGWDLSHNIHVTDGEVQIDGVAVTTTSDTLTLTPEEHAFWAVNELYDNMQPVGIDDPSNSYPVMDPETIIDISSDATVTAYYTPMCQLTLIGYDAYGGNYMTPGNGYAVAPCVSVDNSYLQTPITITVPVGYHYITFDQYCGSFYLPWYQQTLTDGDNWYNNGDPIPIYSDTGVVAVYTLGG